LAIQNGTVPNLAAAYAESLKKGLIRYIVES